MTAAETYAKILTAPGDAFEHLGSIAPARTNWLVPVLCYIVIAAATMHFTATQPSIETHYRQLSEDILRPQLEHQVHGGNISRNQAEWLFRFATPGTPHFFIAQLGGTTITAFGALFIFAFLFWQIGRSVLGGGVPYMKIVEVVGLTFLVAIVERIATSVLMVMTGSIHATPSPGLFLIDNAEHNHWYAVLSRINVFTFWQLWVISTGMSWIYERDFAKVFVLALSLWFLWSLVSVLQLVF